MIREKIRQTSWILENREKTNENKTCSYFQGKNVKIDIWTLFEVLYAWMMFLVYYVWVWRICQNSSRNFRGWHELDPSLEIPRLKGTPTRRSPDQKPYSWTYNFVKLSWHNLESSHTSGFCMDFLNHMEEGVFFLLSPLQCTVTEL